METTKYIIVDNDPIVNLQSLLKKAQAFWKKFTHKKLKKHKEIESCWQQYQSMSHLFYKNDIICVCAYSSVLLAKMQREHRCSNTETSQCNIQKYYEQILLCNQIVQCTFKMFEKLKKLWWNISQYDHLVAAQAGDSLNIIDEAVKLLVKRPYIQRQYLKNTGVPLKGVKSEDQGSVQAEDQCVKSEDQGSVQAEDQYVQEKNIDIRRQGSVIPLLDDSEIIRQLSGQDSQDLHK